MKRNGDRKFVFGRGKSETRGFAGWSKSKERLDKLVKVADWTHHDFRRTFSTIMHEERIPTPDTALPECGRM
jgi:hypothetical protein